MADPLKFYTKVWLSNAKLRMCSEETRGVWIDLMCYMHNSEKYGYVYFAGKALCKEEIRRLLKVVEEEKFEKIWGELTNLKILKVDEEGRYYSSGLIKRKKGKFSRPSLMPAIEDPTERKAKTEIISLIPPPVKENIALPQVSDKSKEVGIAIMKSTYSEDVIEKATDIMAFFNDKVGTKYEVYTSETIKLISQRLKQGYTVEDFKCVIERKVFDWKETENKKYLRPGVLFTQKFQKYIAEANDIQMSDSGIDKKKLIGDAMDFFKELYFEKFKTKYIATPYDKTHLSHILDKIISKTQEAKMPLTMDIVLKNYNLFLTKIKDKWILENFNLSIINSKFNDIYVQIKLAASGKGKNDPTAAKSVTDRYKEKFGGGS